MYAKSFKLLLIDFVSKMTYVNVKNKVITFISDIANQNQQRGKQEGKINGSKYGRR